MIEQSKSPSLKALIHYSGIRQQELIKSIAKGSSSKSTSQEDEIFRDYILAEIKDLVIDKETILALSEKRNRIPFEPGYLYQESCRIMARISEDIRIESAIAKANRMIASVKNLDIDPVWIEKANSRTIEAQGDLFNNTIKDCLILNGHFEGKLSSEIQDAIATLEFYKDHKSFQLDDFGSDASASKDGAMSVSRQRQVKTDSFFGQSSALDNQRYQAKKQSEMGLSDFENTAHLDNCEWALGRYFRYQERLNLGEIDEKVHWCIERAKKGRNGELVKAYLNRQLDVSMPPYIDPKTGKVSKILINYIVCTAKKPEESFETARSSLFYKMNDHDYLLEKHHEMYYVLLKGKNELSNAVRRAVDRLPIDPFTGYPDLSELKEVFIRDIPEWYHRALKPRLTESELIDIDRAYAVFSDHQFRDDSRYERRTPDGSEENYMKELASKSARDRIRESESKLVPLSDFEIKELELDRRYQAKIPIKQLRYDLNPVTVANTEDTIEYIKTRPELRLVVNKQLSNVKRTVYTVYYQESVSGNA